MAVLKRKSWMVNRQPPPTTDQGPQAIIRYLANYVTGTCIHNARLLEHTAGRVSIRVKDYKSGQVQQVWFEAPEFVRRFVLHILPRGLRRMRYSGLFTPVGLEKRLETARQLIAQQREGGQAECHVERVEASTDNKTDGSVNDQAVLLLAAEGDPDEESMEEIEADEEQEAVACKTCSRCQAEMKSLGRLKGRETLQMIRLADDIDEKLADDTPLLRLELLATLIEIFRQVWRLKDLPTPIRGLMRRYWLDHVESSALRALLERKLPASMRNAPAEEGAYTSGVPPPKKSEEVVHAKH